MVEGTLLTDLKTINQQVQPTLRAAGNIESDLASTLRILENLGQTLFLDTHAFGVEVDLLGNSDYSLKGLQASQSILARLTLANGSISGEDIARIKKIDSDLKKSVSILEFYEKASQKWKDVTKAILAQKTELPPQPLIAPVQKIRQIMQQLEVLYLLREEVRQRFKNEVDPMSQIRWDEIAILKERVLKDHPLEVKISGSGTVKIMPIGKECSTNCTSSIAYGAEIDLSVSSGTLTKWGGVCSGTGTCKAVVTDDTTVSATF